MGSPDFPLPGPRQPTDSVTRTAPDQPSRIFPLPCKDLQAMTPAVFRLRLLVPSFLAGLSLLMLSPARAVSPGTNTDSKAARERKGNAVDVAISRFRTIIEQDSGPDAEPLKLHRAALGCSATAKIFAEETAIAARRKTASTLRADAIIADNYWTRQIISIFRPYSFIEASSGMKETGRKIGAALGKGLLIRFPVDSWTNDQWSAMFAPCRRIVAMTMLQGRPSKNAGFDELLERFHSLIAWNSYSGASPRFRFEAVSHCHFLGESLSAESVRDDRQEQARAFTARFASLADGPLDELARRSLPEAAGDFQDYAEGIADRGEEHLSPLFDAQPVREWSDDRWSRTLAPCLLIAENEAIRLRDSQ